MKYVHLYAGPDGESHWEDLEMTMAPVPGRHSIGHSWRVKEAIFTESTEVNPALAEWHNAPARQLVVQLAGQQEIEASDGGRRVLGAGDIMFVEDTTGKGHRVHAHGPRRTMHVPLAE